MPQDLQTFLICVLVVVGLLYAAYLYVTTGLDVDIWEPYQPRSAWPPYPLSEPKALLPAPAPRELKDLGAHHNPLSLAPGDCKALFEKLDGRTWQCMDCRLVQFEKDVEATNS